MSKVLDTLRERVAELQIAIRVLEREEGATPERVQRRQDAAGAALAAHSSNGHEPARKNRSGRFSNDPHSPFRSTGREVVELDVPAGLILAGKSMADAIRLTFEAVPDAVIPSPELTSLLQRAGATFPRKTKYPARYVGQIAGMLGRRKELKKTPEGWRRTAKLAHVDTV